MPNVGYNQVLKISRETSAGLYLADEEGEEVLLPYKYAPENFHFGDEIEVFVYPDAEGRPIATTSKAHLGIGQFAFLQVKHTGPYGAFVDIGSDKDLLVPFREQNREMHPGQSYVVYMYLDEQSDRLVGSCMINKFLEPASGTLKSGQEVEILIYERTDLGWNAIVSEKYRGLLYSNEVFEHLEPGLSRKAFVRKVREDGRIDLRLSREGLVHIISSADQILEKLSNAEGYLAVTDNSSPEEIMKHFKISKKAFKKAIGTLYKSGKISLEADGIRILKKE